MKTRNIVIASLLCLLCAAPLSARQFEQGEKIYVNADQSGRDGSGKFNWANDNAKLFMWIWEAGKDGQQKELINENGNIFSCAMPQGEFNRCIIIRMPGGSTGIDWNNNWGKSQNLTIPGQNALDRNFLNQYWQGDGDGGSNWLTYVPSTAKIAAYASALSSKQETIVVCPSALGGPYTLHAKLKADKSDYDYANVQCHGWYKSTNGTTWTSVDDYAGKSRDGEGDKDIIKNDLPASGVIYYYLHSAKAAGRRLIKITTDGAKDCDLDCTITAFEVACSAVNANDTTYTLDGMVAFGEPNGKLVIECDGKKTTIDAPKSPQIFSVEGLRAVVVNGKTTTAKAYFTGNNGCSATATVNIPNATQGIVRTHLDVLVGETTTLNPKGANYQNDHKWFVNGVEKPEMQGAQTSIAFNEPNSTNYMYREFKTPPDDMKDMMSNGSYEDATFNYGTTGKPSTISDYDFWGVFSNASTATNYYDTHPGENNGFAVVQDANKFASTYAKVKAREGSYFALFDAASGTEMAGKKAWKAETKNNTKLTLQKGTTYLFSFWAANINNYGEMDNAAKLQFQIEYNSQTKKLGEPLDLNSSKFRNNRWHQCSATFTADADASNVTISVINLNTNALKTGNDFALDDIQFRAVSSPTHSVKIQEVITVTTHEPAITKFTATPVQMDCGKSTYNVNLHIDYKNQIGKIIVKDITDGGDRVVWEKDLTPLTNGSKQWDQTLSIDQTVQQTIAEGEPLVKERTYKIYFEKWDKATQQAKFKAPVIPTMQVTYYNNPDTLLACEQTTYSISGTMTYRNMNAKAYAWIDNAAKVEITGLTMNSSDQLTASFTVSEVPADAKDHVLHVAFEGRGNTCPFEDSFRAATAPGKCCTEGRIFSKWDNVLFVNNGDSIYVAYQWYKNGAALNGETQQRLYTGATTMKGTSDLYHCVATRKDKTADELCAHAFDDFPESRNVAVDNILLDGITVYPTQVAAGAEITVTKTVTGAVKATLLTLTGQTVSTVTLSADNTTLTMPAAAGMYLLQLQGMNTQRTIKINVY